MFGQNCDNRVKFQSTPPARGATAPSTATPAFSSDFNPRPPRGGRLTRLAVFLLQPCISIHAPREGGDAAFRRLGDRFYNFNPRPPRGGRRRIKLNATQAAGISIHAPREGGDKRLFIPSPTQYISIHAPREGGDVLTASGRWVSIDFNPRPPRGGRPLPPLTASRASPFQSTPPARGATAKMHSFTCGSLTNE